MGAKRAPTSAAGLTLDTGALIAIERGDRRLIALLQQSLSRGVPLRAPAGAVGQAWRGGARQATLARFLRSREVEVPALDELLACAAGELCGLTGTADVIDASVVLTALRTRDSILTSDPTDIRRLDATVTIERV
jgi:hypothetical protein